MSRQIGETGLILVPIRWNMRAGVTAINELNETGDRDRKGSSPLLIMQEKKHGPVDLYGGRARASPTRVRASSFLPRGSTRVEARTTNLTLVATCRGGAVACTGGRVRSAGWRAKTNYSSN